MSEYYFTDETGNLQGPYSLDEFESRISSGEITHETQCRANYEDVSVIEIVGQSKFAMLTDHLPTSQNVDVSPEPTTRRQWEGKFVSFVLAIFTVLFVFVIPMPWSIFIGLVGISLSAIIYFMTQK